MNVIETLHHQPFYWNHNTTIDYYLSNDIEKRNIEDIAPEEVIVALEEVVTNNLSIEEDELLQYLTHTFGFQKSANRLTFCCITPLILVVKQEKVN